MAMKHQRSENETHTPTADIGVRDFVTNQTQMMSHSANGSARKTKGIDLTMVSLVSAMIAIQLTLMIALITPKGPVAQRIVTDAVMDQPVADAPLSAPLELPASSSIDKRFMNGLEVAPAPADSDPFASNETKPK